MGGVIGLDIGGANTKAVRRDGATPRAVTRAFEVWRDPHALAAVLRDVLAELRADSPALVALTMTAELADAFATKRDGVAFVLDAAESAIDERVPLLVLTTGGELVEPDAARERPLDVAAANWVASAMAVADTHSDALMLDVGSTTADVIPIAGGRVAAAGRTDLDRLLAGELVYTGALRTPVAAICSRVPLRGRSCPVASAAYAISGDVHLILGHLAPAAYTCPTPDGRAASVEAARRRLARMLCADVEQLEPGEIEAIAAHVHAEQVDRIASAAREAAARLPAGAPVVPLGSGAFVAPAVAERVGRPVAELGWSAAEREAGPAAALARLAAARAGMPC